MNIIHTIPEQYLWHTMKGDTGNETATIKIYFRNNFYYMVSEITSTPLQLPHTTEYATLIRLATHELTQRLQGE